MHEIDFIKIFELKHEYCETIPSELESGIAYISEKYGVSIHLCACGCGEKTVLPLEKNGSGWVLIKNEDGTVSFTPSIGNWSGENPYHAHYFITKNKIIWC